MSDGIKLVGYSSDGLIPTAKDYSKHILNTHWFEKPASGVIYFVYKVNGVIRYYLREQALMTLKYLYGKNVSKQGIRYESSEIHYYTDIKRVKKYHAKKCCYCEVELSMSDNKTPTSHTREHIIPKHKGGTILKDCCYQCNQEKGGLMLHTYIQLLNLMLADKTGADLIKLQTKIRNANKIAKELSLNG